MKNIRFSKFKSIYLVIFLVIAFLSIGYSAYNASLNINQMSAIIRLNTDIRITGVNVDSHTSDALSSYEDYNVSNISSELYLPNRDSSITYKVSITNFEKPVMGLFDITGLSNNLEYFIADKSNYTMKDKLCNDNGQCNLGMTKDLYITIKYKDGMYDSNNILYNIVLNFDFRIYHTVSYENLYGAYYPNGVIDGGDLTVDIEDDIDLTITDSNGYIFDSNNDYEYKNGVLTIQNVTSDLFIKANSKILITNVSYEDNDNLEIIKYHNTRLKSKVVLSDNDINSSVTYNVTIKNSTNYNYVFTGVSSDNYDNNNIIYELSGIKVQDRIISNDSLTFSVTFRYDNDVILEDENFNNVLNSFLNFNFEYVITPVLANNMIPVTYGTNSWSKISSNSDNWYNYFDGKWANAVTYNHGLAYNEVSNNTELKQFNGTSDYIILGRKNYNFGSNITLVARFKIYEYGTDTQIAVGNIQGGGFYIGLSADNKIRFRHTDTSTTTSTSQNLYSNNKIELDTWYTAVVTYDGSMLKLYVDGVLEDSLEYTNGISVSAAPIAIGGNPDLNDSVSGSYFKGAISEIAVMKNTLSSEEIAKNYGDKTHHIPTKHDVLYYLKFDADDGVVANSAKYESDGMSFDGVDDHISVGYSMYDFENTFTIGARVKLDSYFNDEYSIFGNPQSGGLNLFKDVNNKFSIAVYNSKTSSYVNLETDFTPELDTWYTIIATYDGTSLRFYVDGIQVDYTDVAIELAPITTPFMIGVNPNLSSSTSGYFFDGKISDIILVDEALTANQIKTYYSSDLTAVVSNKTLISYNLRGYESRGDGTVIPEEMINSMWVWIPRFNATTPNKAGTIDVSVVGTEDDSHDAFNFSGSELDGFWVGKFENGANVSYENTSLNISANSNVIIKPNYNSLINKNIGSMFASVNDIMNLTDIYGLNSSMVDTHLIKNNEWAAVAYLTQSKYGLCNSGSCGTLESNSTNYVTGGTDYTINTGQSTTGNVYGVYDMNGGTTEFVMGNYNNTLNTLDGFSSLPDSKYLNVYTTENDYSLNNLQHAMFETNNLFNNSIFDFVTASNVWLTRNNLFSYSNSTGASGSDIGSRSVLVIK